MPIPVSLPQAAPHPSLRGWIPTLRAVSCTDTRTTGAKSPRQAVRLPIHGSALVLGASCVDHGLSLSMNGPPGRPVPPFLPNVLISLIRCPEKDSARE